MNQAGLEPATRVALSPTSDGSPESTMGHIWTLNNGVPNTSGRWQVCFCNRANEGIPVSNMENSVPKCSDVARWGLILMNSHQELLPWYIHPL
jgi:hypothetical protein